MPKVSVIIPCYNLGKYIDQAVESVLNQTYQDFEIIIVNDGSTDKFTNTKLSNYQRPKTKVITTKNKGVSAARNLAIKNATGEFILPLDADDKIENTYLEKAILIFEQNQNIKVVYCNTQQFGNTKNKINYPNFELNSFLLNNCIHVAGFFRKKDFLNTKGYDKSMLDGLEDWEFWISMLKTGGKVYKIEESLLFYRRYVESRQSLLDKNRSRNLEIRQYIVEKHLALYSKVFGTPMFLYQKNIQLDQRITNLENSQALKLGNLMLKPIRFLKRLANKLT